VPCIGFKTGCRKQNSCKSKVLQVLPPGEAIASEVQNNEI